MDYILLVDILGVITFSISGVLSSLKKRMDAFGILIIAFVTSVGGGTIRDVLIGSEVMWMQEMIYVYVILITTILAVIFRKKLAYMRKSLFLFDTLGIGLYTVVGVEKGINYGFSAEICIAIGTMSACFGGVIRDTLCNEIPVIFRKEVYATACILGGLSYFLLLELNVPKGLIFIIAGVVVILVRLAAVVFKISLPSIYKKEENIEDYW
ncbi:trimeric intracellular cation channel family protein [Psychroflexus sp. ALD_RP9]|uniref:trimeric intracellular cation channel family protein n=1 Tax=Psychroflexus sp. ALD_RP9 TaxID=2777186 RepID=UPI001A8CC6F8|nr:trimeric intracellular cation channel family protein [Psychroflexus sp. ALD_RP9]QSS96737.1 trimeric intracellular cation channel family protein [Psychroflexus sp. ALD_RP9]